jgi:hypothetical protein
MNAKTLILSLMSAYATDNKIETCEIVLSKLRKAQAEKALPKGMLRRAIKIQQSFMAEMKQNPETNV